MQITRTIRHARREAPNQRLMQAVGREAQVLPAPCRYAAAMSVPVGSRLFGARPLLRVPGHLILGGGEADVVDARVVADDARVGEQRDAVEVLPQDALDDRDL